MNVATLFVLNGLGLSGAAAKGSNVVPLKPKEIKQDDPFGPGLDQL
jgi:hypothetical protein